MLSGFLIGLLLFIFPIVGFNFEFFPGDLADGRLNLYFLEHAYQFFTGQVSSLWDAPFMFPEKNTLAFSDNLLGSAPIYSFFRIIGLNTYLSYQLWYVVVSALNYITAYYLLKHLFKNNYAAVIGAFVFAFSIALNSQLGHAQTFPRFAIPFAILMAVKFKKDLNPTYFFFCILTVVYQIYCGIYLGFMLVVPTALFLLITITGGYIFHKKKILKLVWHIKILIGTIVNVLLLIPLMLPYLERKILANSYHFNEILHSVPTLTSYVFSHKSSLLWSILSNVGKHYEAFWDHQIFTGIIASLSFLAAGFFVLKKAFKTKFNLKKASSPSILIVVGIITLLLFLRFDKVTAYKIIYYIPGFNSMRSLTRIINVELIFFAIATSYVFCKLFMATNIKKEYIFIIALTLISFDNYSFTSGLKRTTVVDSVRRTNVIENAFSKLPKSAVVSYEPIQLNSNPSFYQIDAMLMAQKYNLTCMNAYSADSPVDFYEYWKNPTKKWRNYWLSGKSFKIDTLYVVNEEKLLKINVEELHKEILTKEEKKLETIITNIKNDPNWLNKIKEGALRDNISVDSMLILNAEWVIWHEKQEEEKLHNLINYIKNDPNWMIDIRRKAEEKDIPIDSVIIQNAKWVLKKEN